MRAAVTVIFFAALVAFSACESTRDSGCYSNNDCASGYLCDDSIGVCVAPSNPGTDSCRVPSDCAASYTCGKAGRCLPGDCFFNACVTGFQCSASTGKWECLSISAGEAGAAGASSDERENEAGAGGAR